MVFKMRLLALVLLASAAAAQKPVGGGGSSSGGGGAAPGGAAEELQYNNAGALGGTKDNTWSTIQYNAAVNSGVGSSFVFIGTGLNDFSGVNTPGSEAATGAPAGTVFRVIIDGTGSPNTFKWNANAGAFTTGVPIVAGTTIDLGIYNANVKFSSATGHTLGNEWLMTVFAGIQMTRSVGPTSGANPSVALSGLPGSVTNGSHTFRLNWATAEGETYSLGIPVSVTVTDNTVSGSVVISGIVHSTNARSIGSYIWMTDVGGTEHLAAFVPLGTTSVTINKADASLGSSPLDLDHNSLDSTAPCFTGELEGRDRIGCYLQLYDYGVKMSDSFWVADLIYTKNAPLVARNGYMDAAAVHGTTTAGEYRLQLSDNTGTTDHAALFDSGGRVTNGPAGVTASGSACTITAITKGIITAATCAP